MDWTLKALLAELAGVAIGAVYLFFRDRNDRAAMRYVKARYPYPPIANTQIPTVAEIGPAEWVVRPPRS